MKTNKRYGILSILMIAFTILSCVHDGDFTVPNVTVQEPNITPNSSVLAIKTALQQEFISNGNLVYTFFDNPSNPTYLEAYVVSSDAAGNFYKKLIVQDKAENPTAGIEIDLNKSSLSETYEVGRKIYIKLDGLSVSYDDGERTSFISPLNGVPGKYILGILVGGQLGDIPSTSIKNHIWRSATVAKIVPSSINIANIKGANINTMIQLASAQMIKSDLTRTFAGEPSDSFDGFRTIFECDTEKTIQLQTSTFASFKSNVVPQGKGVFTAVLSKNYRSEFLVAIVNTPADLNFTDASRCDPPVLECIGTAGGSVVLLDEGFESISSATALTAAGWTNVNVNGGSTLYALKNFRGNNYVQISAFRSGESPLEAWLVSPEIDLDTTTGEALTFETNTGYYKGKAMSVYLSSDFTGDVTTATWLKVNAVLSEGPSSGYGSSFTSSGSINISCLTGKVHLAFKYAGADGGVTTTFQVDNVKITGN